MVFYFYSVVIPILIYGVFAIMYAKDLKFSLLLKAFIRALPYLYLYLFVLYYLEREDLIETGWAFYTLMFFLVPLSIIGGLLFYFVQRKSS